MILSKHVLKVMSSHKRYGSRRVPIDRPLMFLDKLKGLLCFKFEKTGLLRLGLNTDGVHRTALYPTVTQKQMFKWASPPLPTSINLS
jgi:hypothetical protein